MSRYTKAVDIWPLTSVERAQLAIGQWVYAGDESKLGRFYGEGSSTVVAWLGNARSKKRGHYASYMATICTYGQTVRKPR